MKARQDLHQQSPRPDDLGLEGPPLAEDSVQLSRHPKWVGGPPGLAILPPDQQKTRSVGRGAVGGEGALRLSPPSSPGVPGGDVVHGGNGACKE